MTDPWPELPLQERMRLKFLMDSDDEKHTPPVPPVILEPGHEIPLSELCKQAGEVAALLTGNGRTVSARRGRVLVEGQPFKTGKRVGEMRPDKTITGYAIATTDFKDPVITANWYDNKLDFAQIGWHDGRRTWVTLVTTLKNLIRGEQNGENK